MQPIGSSTVPKVAGANYALKQKECQEIHIYSNNSTEYVSLHNLIPNFNTISAQLGTSDNDLYYQVKSFRFANRFYNLLANDKIQIASRITWLTALNTTTEKDGMEDPPIELILTTENKVVTAAELVAIVNDRINDYMLAMHGISATTTQIANFMNIFSCCSFVYVTDTGKFGFQAGPATNYTVKYTYPTAPTLSAFSKFMLIAVDVRIPTDVTTVNQVRLARMFGLNSLITFSQPQDDITFDTPLTVALQHRFTVEQFYDLVEKKRLSSEPDWIGRDYTTFRPDNPYYLTAVADVPMNLNRYDHIYIRSSLASNIWHKDGRRSNKIACIPISSAIDEIAFEYQPASVGERVYNIKDSLSGLQNFQLSFSDEYEQQIEFIENYYLVIALFFTPQNQIN